MLAQKIELGVTEEDYETDPEPVDLDPPASRAVARELAEQSVILLDNDGTLPLSGVRTVCVAGPNGDSPEALMGNYSFTNHVETPPGTPLGIDVPTVLAALRDELAGVDVRSRARLRRRGGRP